MRRIKTKMLLGTSGDNCYDKKRRNWRQILSWFSSTVTFLLLVNKMQNGL